MPQPGTASHPLRVAVIGSGPAAFYAAEHLLGHDDLVVQLDMFERLPTPFGLVRFGVAPDHAKIKNVTRVYEKIARRPGFRFFGNVEFGTHLTLEDLRRHYHQVCFATGAQTDRRMNVPGEDLERSHTATEFVAWYNGHPDYRDRVFDLSVERVAVVGIGNVAVDVARILCRTPDELRQTDIADYALDALAESRVREVVILGRRGPAQAAFTNAEVKELGEMAGADFMVRPEEVTLDPLSRAAVAELGEPALEKKVELLQGFAAAAPRDKAKTLTLRFLVSPVALVGDGAGKVVGMTLVQNELHRSDDGSLRPRATDRTEELAVELVFRSVGYRGVPLPGVPFHEQWGVVPNQGGRVTTLDGEPLPGLYASGWIKRGPSGVIGTNKPCAAETVEAMVRDVAGGAVPLPAQPDPAAAEALLRERQPRTVSFEEWRLLDAVELERGKAQGRPRVKLTSVDEMLAALGK
ncbi:MAG: FAD-dependent oxidoreductase [Gemmatimonadota bacterium]|nr:MAG: FAD-dependent oxidoreductase [Gemmatimonadota bacterium]